MAKNAIGMAMACAERGKALSNGTWPSGVLKYPGTFKNPGRMRKSWQQTFGGSQNATKVTVLEEA